MKSVDAKKAIIVVGGETFKVHSSAQIKVNGTRSKLDKVEPGMDVVLTFNSPRSPVRMVSKIEATGTRVEPGTEDLPRGPVQDQPEGLPWMKPAFIQLSPSVVGNFLWTAQESPTSVSVLWKASFVDTSNNATRLGSQIWVNPEPLFPAKECSECGGVNVVVWDGGPLLHASRADPPLGPLSQPRPISDVKKHGLLRSPRLMPDGLFLYCDRVNGGIIQPVVFRIDPSERRLWDFDSPTEIKVPAAFTGRLRNINPLGNGRALACLQDQQTTGPTVFVLSGGDGLTSFTSCDPVLPADPRGGHIRGFSPSAWPATGEGGSTELFLTGLGPGKDGHPAAFVFRVMVQELR